MKTAVLGAGRMGRRHIQVVRDLGLELVGVCDANPDALALAAKEQDVPPALHFTDASRLLKQTQPDCVIVATTAPSHCEYTCTAAEAGAKFILCEKPMAISLAECDQMLDVCARYGARLAINHQMRFMEQYTEPKRIINTDSFGGLASVSVRAGTFGLAMNGTHYFEMFRYMTDEAPANVIAWFSPGKVPNPRGIQYEDRAGAVRITTASGKRFYLETSYDQGHGITVVYAGRYGQIIVDELAGNMQWVEREEQYRNLPTTRYGMGSISHSQSIPPADVIEPSKAVLKALLEGNDYPTGQDGRQAVAVLVAAYISDEQGNRTVTIDNQLPIQRVFPWA